MISTGVVFCVCIGGAISGEAQESDRAPQYGGVRIDFEVGSNQAFVILPPATSDDKPTPWVWYAPTLAGRLPDETHEWLFTRLLAAGFAIAGVDVGESYGNPEGRQQYDAFYKHVVAEHRLTPKACLVPQSRGGLMLYNWAAEHPHSVQCIGGIYTVCDVSSWPGLDKACAAYKMSPTELAKQLADHNPVDRLEPLVKAGVPILHVHGDSDTVVPIERNSGEVARRYRRMGGDARVVVIPGKGHEVCDEFFKNQELLDFLIRNGAPAAVRGGAGGPQE